MDATTTGDPPAPTNCFGGDISRSVWYRFTPATNGLYTLSLKDNATTLVDTLMGIYTSPTGCGGPFQPFDCNDDAGLGEQVLRSAITANLTAGTAYYIVVWHTLTNAPAAGESLVQLTVSKPEIPSNDRCSGAEVIPATAGTGTTPYVTAITDTYRATTNADPPSPTCHQSGFRSVWYKFTPSASGGYIFSTCTNSTQTRIYDTLLGIYTASAGCGSAYTPVGCSDNFCGFSASATVNLVSGTDYYITVWDLEPDPQSGETTLQLQVTRQSAPIVTTRPASSLTVTGAVLNGIANPRGLLTRGYFEWGATTNYLNVTTTTILGNGTADVPFSRSITGLSPGATYHYRAVATNSLGIRFGDDAVFTLPGLPPRITRVSMGTGGARIEFSGMTGFAYKVDGSDDLKKWNELGTATALGGGRYEYVDAGALQRPYRFYRVRL